MALHVITPGPSTTVQDRGRIGYQDRGFSPAGVMDWRAAALGNVLVGNDRDAAVLEFTLAGPELRFDEPAVIALTGADVRTTLDGSAVASNCALSVNAGATLRVGPARRGQFGYLAVAGGGIGTAPAMGSRATSVRYGLGGLDGRRLQAGDVVPLATEAPAKALPAMGARAVFAEDAFYGWDAPTTWVRVVPAQDTSAFTSEGLASFWEKPFEVTGRSDRMGYRLSGPRVRLAREGGIVSEGVALGTIQVPPDGEPIVMLADHQTTGGYAKIGTVALCDIPRLVQCTPGRALRFERIDVTLAQQLLRDDAAYLHGLRSAIEREAEREHPRKERA
ncbi:MAG: biotin-dependent carboxyltransferase family protein [Coriobacteriia bacterium]|nr:biotin-dependent carboxyltransferase family protein [Coriobacteriia bacterium]